MKYHFITDFYASREGRIGSADISACIPHPIKKNESLAGYEKTAISLYYEKIGETKREKAGFSARVGNDLEPLCLQYFIEDVYSEETALDFFQGYILCELERRRNKTGIVNCESFNNTQFKHHTEFMNDFGVAHPDTLYIPIIGDKGKIKVGNITFDKSKKAIIEAKSGQYWAVKRKDDEYSGYDSKIEDWSGVPLKHYFQVQYQMALSGEKDIDGFLPLLSNTSEKHYWHIKPNKKHQADLLELAEYMKKCIDKRTPPKEKAMNASDIAKLYPEIKEDFREVVGKELQTATEIAKEYQHAKRQVKQWELKERDCIDAMSVLLKDQQELKGLIGDELQTIARWKGSGGSDYIMGIADMKKENPKELERLKKLGLIKQKKESMKPEIKLEIED